MAGQGVPDVTLLKKLSLEDLGKLEVTTVSKEPEELRRTAAAIHVITQEDIRRSGATTLAEVLRLAPGLNVARIDTTHWSVGVRGFGDQFSKSVLLLIDGRSVYTQLFGGVFWAHQDVLMEDIERIEVIRGPGGTIWGANAVNGVINVVTRHAADTQGVLATAAAGDVDELQLQTRYGGRWKGLDFRVFGKGFRKGPQAHEDDRDFDIWRRAQVGGRVDWTGSRDALTVQGDVYDSQIGQSVSLASFAPAAQTMFDRHATTAGANVMLAWQRTLANRGHFQLRTFYDRTDIDAPQLGEVRQTFDIDVTHRFPDVGRHGLTWGAGARWTPSTFEQTVDTLDLAPHEQTNQILSAFVQDDLTIVPEKLGVTIGSKFEHHSYVGSEVQPSARVLWTPTFRHSIWGSVARAVRTPSRLEHDFTLHGFLGRQALPIYVRIAPNPDFESERHVAYEAGYRTTVTPNLYVDTATFYNRHDRLQSLGSMSTVVESSPPPLRAVVVFPQVNGVRGSSHGIEFAPSWTPLPNWHVRGSYAYLHLDLENRPGNTDTGAVTTYEGSSPRHTVQLQSLVTLRPGLELDLNLRRVGALPARKIAAYAEADLRVGWRSARGLEIALLGRNLLHASHGEFGHDPPPTVAVRRTVTLTATWSR